MAKKLFIAITLTAISFAINPATSFSRDNVVVNQAKAAGLQDNLKTVEELAGFLTDNANNFGSHSIWSTDAGDRRMFTSVIESVYSDGSIFNFMAVSPDLDSSIPDYAYVRIFYEPQTMIDVRENLYGDWAYKGILANNVIMLNSGDLHVYLMPAGSGTLVVRRELGAGF